ncbi:MAG: CHAT domain-containing tetratricopeptide repeat protein, partial [Saprospiraceae bacterium]
QSFGEFYLEAEIYPAAIIQLDSCLFLKERKFGVRSYYLLGTLRTLGAAYAGSKQFAKATICYRRGLQIAVDSMGNNHQKAALFYSELAAVQLAQGDFRSSLVLCDTAFAFLGFDPEHPEKAVPRDFFRELCQRTANALVQQYQQQGDLAALYRADHYFTLAAETLHREIEEVMVNSSREILYDRDHVGLEQGLDTRMLLFDATRDPQYLEASFQIASQGKAFLLSESMRQNGALRYAGVPDSILQAEWSLREKILEAEKKLEKSPSYAGKTAALPLNSDLYDWRAAYETLLGRIETNYPAYFHLRQLRRELSSRELRRKWLAPGQSLLMYSLTAEHTYAFVVTRDTFCCVALPSDVSLPTTVESLRSSLTAYYTASQPDDALYDRSMATYLASAQSLYRYLVAPVAQFLSGRVVIIPDGVLCYLPFEALLTGAPADPGNFRSYPFWIRQTAISYALSTDYLVETTLPPPAKPKKTWLGVAPFSGDRSIGDTTTLVSRNEHFSALPFSGKEVTDIANLVQGEAWLGAAATPGRFEKEAFRYRILHLATHSRVDDRSGDYSYMATASTGDPLFARDLYLLTISAEMVVLSSCEAGGGKLLHGEGIIGMVRAFTFAGARSVVAPLWATNDQSNAGLMVSFYRNLQKGQPKDRALQQACLNLLDHTPTESHPFFWAGFRVFGQVNPLWK